MGSKSFTTAVEKNNVASNNEAPVFNFDIGSMSSGSNLSKSGGGGQAAAGGGGTLNSNSGINVEMLDGNVIGKTFDFLGGAFENVTKFASQSISKASDMQSLGLAAATDANKNASLTADKETTRYILIGLVVMAVGFFYLTGRK